MATPAHPVMPDPAPVPQPVYPGGQMPAEAPPQVQVPSVPPTFQPQAPVPLPAYEQPIQTTAQAPAPVQIPEGGYAQRFVTIRLAQYDQPGVQCSVRLRNPGLMSQGTFESVFDAVDGLELDENGEPKVNGAAAKAAIPALYAQLLKLISSWTMWDAESDAEEPTRLPSPPASVDDLRRAPAGAVKAIMAAVQELSDPQ
jgi:hypothetical protein